MPIYYRLGGLNNRNLFSYSFGGWKPKIKVPAELVSGENSPPGLQMAGLLPPTSSHGRESKRAGASSGLFL